MKLFFEVELEESWPHMISQSQQNCLFVAPKTRYNTKRQNDFNY